MTRRLSQKGQTNACGDYPAEPTKFPPNDCGERRYMSSHAFIRPDWRDSVGTLEEILSPLEELRMTSLLAISIDAPAQQFLYRRCDVPAASFPTGIQNVGVPLVRGTTLRKLRSMKIGQTVEIKFAPAGKANCMRSLPPGETCKFSVVIQVDITRVKPPSGR